MTIPLNKIRGLFQTYAAVAARPGDLPKLFFALVQASDVWEGFEQRLLEFDFAVDLHNSETPTAEVCSIALLRAAHANMEMETMSKAMMLFTTALVLEAGIDGAAFAELVAFDSLQGQDRADFLQHMTQFADGVLAERKERSH